MRLPDMKGRRALVTGASRGIGRATGKMLLEQGCRVFGLARGDWAPDAEHPRFHPLDCDLSEAEDIRAVFAKIRKRTTLLDYVVNVAGIDPKYPIGEGDEARWREVVDLNLRAFYLVIRESLPFLRAGKGRSIVNVSSINYRLGIPKRSIYSASKAGILGLTTGLARELGEEGIRINTVSPGWVFTERQVAQYFTSPRERRKNLAYLESRQALKHRITPEDVARHILFYLSEASAASTGHNCVVDAGWLLE
jgi:NAD(P)-dependent dehydrogenase (short-subunit alcohol dehydrogenase family)